MSAERASFSIAADGLRASNELVPSAERSALVERMTRLALVERRKSLAALSDEFETRPDFAAARADGEAFNATVADCLDN